jgi:hypothetical protein
MMKNFLLILLTTSYALFADALPTEVKTTISSIGNNGEIQLASTVPKGMSGVIVHDYGNGLSAITHTSFSTGAAKATVSDYTAIEHKNIPSIQTAVQVGDQVIFGNFYDNVLIIAPNKESYRNITKQYKRTWLHSDAYALEFMRGGETSLSLENIQQFAQNNQVGLVLIVEKTQLLILDPISKQFLGALPFNLKNSESIAPFYARFKQMDVSTFGFSNKEYTPYFQSVAGLK